MANTLAPQGFQHTGRGEGGAPTFGQTVRTISPTNATPIYTGDPLVDNAGNVQQAAPGAVQLAGIFVGCKYLSIAQQTIVFRQFWPGSDANPAYPVEGYIIGDNYAEFLIQANGQLLPSHVNKNANFALGVGNQANGRSGAVLDVSTIGTTATLPFRIKRLVTNPPGANGSDQTSPFGFAIVGFNNQDFNVLTGN